VKRGGEGLLDDSAPPFQPGSGEESRGRVHKRKTQESSAGGTIYVYGGVTKVERRSIVTGQKARHSGVLAWNEIRTQGDRGG